MAYGCGYGLIWWSAGYGCGLFGVALGCGPAVVTVVVFHLLLW